MRQAKALLYTKAVLAALLVVWEERALGVVERVWIVLSANTDREQ